MLQFSGAFFFVNMYRVNDTNKQAKIAIANDKVKQLGQSRKIPKFFNRMYISRLTVGTIAFGLFVIFFFFWLWPRIYTSSNYSASVGGTVTQKTLPSRSSNGKVTSNSRSVVSYKVGGIEYTVTSGSELFGPSIGSSVDVRYIPGNPQDAIVKMALKQILLLCGLYVGVPAVVFYVGWKYLINRY